VPHTRHGSRPRVKPFCSVCRLRAAERQKRSKASASRRTYAGAGESVHGRPPPLPDQRPQRGSKPRWSSRHGRGHAHSCRRHGRPVVLCILFMLSLYTTPLTCPLNDTERGSSPIWWKSKRGQFHKRRNYIMRGNV